MDGKQVYRLMQENVAGGVVALGKGAGAKYTVLFI